MKLLKQLRTSDMEVLGKALSHNSGRFCALVYAEEISIHRLLV